MNRFRTYKLALLSTFIVAAVLISGWAYISNIQESLWQLSVNDLKEVTAQGGHAFEIYLQKDLENIHGLANGLSQKNSDDVEYMENRLRAFNDVANDSFYTIIDMDRKLLYSTASEPFCTPLAPGRVEAYKTLSGSGLEEPYISGETGIKLLGSYECFTFANGAAGVVRRARPLSMLAEDFSLSVYDGAGSSYVVNQNGDILLRSGNGNLSSKNIFEVMDIEGEEDEENQKIVESFRSSMEAGKGGVLRFTAVDGQNLVYAYVPLAGADGWYFLSVVPSDVIMEQGNHILHLSHLLFAALGVCGLILAVIALLIRQNQNAMKKVNLEIQYREQLFDILTNNTGDVFVMFTSGGRQVEYVSPNTDSVLGIPAEAVMDDVSVLSEDGADNSPFDGTLAPLDSGGSIVIEQERVHRKTGERRWFTITVYQVTIETIDKVILVLSDRTPEKQKERTLEEAMNIAQTANQSKSTFLSNMSHDIRTPMNAIVGLCTLLQRDAEDPDRVRDHTKKITASSQHLLGLINDVLDMSKIESGKTTLNITEINLAEIVEGIDIILRPQAKAKNQSFKITAFNVKSEHLLGDMLRINQILINILSNAVKYTPEGGSIEMTVRELPQTSKNFARLRFSVSDNGIGMSPEYKKTIFQPFTREINSSTNKIQGTGLGMTITKSLVDLMGGNISVDSIPGRGSTFTVDLELRIQDKDVDQDFWKVYGITHALVVDDEVEICTSVISAMAGTGVSMQFALNGKSAVRAVKQAHESGRNFDLVLLDWKMPEMSGIETARQIRRIIPRDTPILVLTAYEWEDIEDEALEAGIDGFLPKPFFFSNFKLTIERMHTKRREDVENNEEDGILNGLHILAAEDNELNSEILNEILEMKGAACDIAENGKKALEMFSTSDPGKYDLILMDVQMPVMNGYEATQAIRMCGHPEAKTIPIIAMTANAFAEDIQKALDSGMNDHVSKPIDLDILEKTIKDAMKK